MSETTTSRRSETVARRYVIGGRVQGVWFRAFTQEAALELGLAGWVRNLPDGSVEARAAGSAAQLAAFRARLGQGPPASRVEAVDEEDLATATDLPAAFEIRY